MAHRGRTGAVVGQQPFGGARASGTNHKGTEAGMNRPELHRRDLRFRCFRRLGELPVYAAVKGPVQLVDQPAPVGGQVGAPLVEQRQHHGQVLDHNGGGVAGQRGHARRRGSASMTSFLRRPPRDNSRTRAVAVQGTSSTCSPRAASHYARWRPRPRAFSTAQRRASTR